MRKYCLTNEQKRTYSIYNDVGDLIYVRTIEDPLFLFCDKGHQFARVQTGGGDMVLVPAPGLIRRDDRVIGYCEVTWVPRDKANPCSF
jgi:hypothetical protein